MKATPREKKIIKIMESNWDSLKSHSSAILHPAKIPKRLRSVVGGQKFDKKCIREYADNIKLLAELL